jgi:hypothetical protein
MEDIDRVWSSMQYLAEQIELRPDGDRYLPLLAKLKDEHDRLSKSESIRDFARQLAASHRCGQGTAARGRALKLGRAA